MTTEQIKHIGKHFRSAHMHNIGGHILRHEGETGVSLLKQEVADDS